MNGRANTDEVIVRKLAILKNKMLARSFTTGIQKTPIIYQAIYGLQEHKKGLTMRKAYTKLYIHYIWSTKMREKSLSNDLVKKLNQHVRDYAGSSGIFIVETNGYLDHCHLLIDLPPSQSPAQAINLIKGEASHWINSNNLVKGKFAWQDKYSAFSVSASQKEKVASYIRNQAMHHTKMTFAEELKMLYERYGLQGPEGPVN